MEFKKCPRCGNFFHSDMDVCQNCKTNELLDMRKLKDYIETNGTKGCSNIQQMAVDTGINAKNLNRLFENDEFSGIVKLDNK